MWYPDVVVVPLRATGGAVVLRDHVGAVTVRDRKRSVREPLWCMHALF